MLFFKYLQSRDKPFPPWLLQEMVAIQLFQRAGVCVCATRKSSNHSLSLSEDSAHRVLKSSFFYLGAPHRVRILSISILVLQRTTTFDYSYTFLLADQIFFGQAITHSLLWEDAALRDARNLPPFIWVLRTAYFSFDLTPGPAKGPQLSITFMPTYIPARLLPGSFSTRL